MTPSRAPIAFGKYRLIEQLGRGGMAEVWRALAEGPGGFARTVVIKRILRAHAGDSRFVDLFFREARLSARLHHANIAQVFDFGEVDGDWFLAMEYLDGRDLGALLREAAPLQPGLAAFIVRDLCRALGYVHAAAGDDGAPLGLVHRDVSLSNVMVCFDGAVKLLDFGVAKALGALGSVFTSPGTLVGKPSYMAPEQIEGRAVDHRADLFAAGVVLFEASTGERLFRAGMDLRAATREREQVLPLPSERNPRVPPGIDRVFRRATAWDPADRYPVAAEMIAELDEVVHAERAGTEALVALMREVWKRDAPSPPPTAQRTPTPPPPGRAGARRETSGGPTTAVIAPPSRAVEQTALLPSREGTLDIGAAAPDAIVEEKEVRPAEETAVLADPRATAAPEPTALLTQAPVVEATAIRQATPAAPAQELTGILVEPSIPPSGSTAAAAIGGAPPSRRRGIFVAGAIGAALIAIGVFAATRGRAPSPATIERDASTNPAAPVAPPPPAAPETSVAAPPIAKPVPPPTTVKRPAIAPPAKAAKGTKKALDARELRGGALVDPFRR